ncbi:hypothetical protein [Victivallis sp. Marseille-Q1083]|uniref:hypothetical protein n=1 Tax=Victivallis sp. Marseille-Q1083 TaxID=2717288 RepID=UPI00158C90F9|nr:hypothetical protein [Victivallis sp. Marseille-Q1083]
MKRLILSLFCLAALLMPMLSQAQVALELKLNRRNFLRYEPIIATVLMRNDSAQPLVFGDDPRLKGELKFEILDRERQPIASTLTDYSLAGLILRAGETKEIKLQLDKYYKLDKSGIYRGHVYITHPSLTAAFQSKDVIFEVTPGVPVWEITVGVPDLDEENKPAAERSKVKNRTFRIVSLMESSDKYYYLIVEDAKMIYAIHCLGQALAEERFQANVDMFSNLHILLPLTPKIFRYFIYNIDGRLTATAVYRSSNSVPSLFRNPENGSVQVLGGELVEDAKSGR